MPISSGGQFHPKAAPRAGRGFHTHASAHPLDGFADNCQSNAGAGIGIDAVQAFEHSEDALMIFRTDANAIVLNPKADEFSGEAGKLRVEGADTARAGLCALDSGGRIFGANADAWFGVGFDKLKRVAEKV